MLLRELLAASLILANERFIPPCFVHLMLRGIDWHLGKSLTAALEQSLVWHWVSGGGGEYREDTGKDVLSVGKVRFVLPGAMVGAYV